MKRLRDNELEELMKKIRKKRYNYLARLKNYNSEITNQYLDIFQKTGLFDKDTGKLLSVKQFREKYLYNENYKVAIMRDILRPEFMKERDEKFRETVVTMLAMMGDEETSKMVENMSLKQFRTKFYKGEFDDIIEKYQTETAITAATSIATKNDDFDFLDKETRQMLGYED